MRHSVTRSIAMVGFATAVGLATIAHANVLVTRDFSADPGFTGSNNTTPDQNYKYSSGTNFAGGAVGEIGGVTSRETFNSFYADARTVPGAFGVDTPMHASGRFIIQNPVAPWDHGIIVGHFNQSDIGDTLALSISEPAGAFTQSRVRAIMQRDNGSNAWALTPLLNVTRGVPHTFSYVWDPTGGTTGRGLLSLTIDGITQTSEDVGGSFNLAERNGSTPLLTGAFNSWGMAVGGAPGVAGTVEVFVDDAIYNLAPEPAALALLGMVWTSTMLRRRRMRH